jgi:hypothetical protein
MYGIVNTRRDLKEWFRRPVWRKVFIFIRCDIPTPAIWQQVVLHHRVERITWTQ